MIIPSLHRQPVPVHPEQHRALRIRPAPADYGFAAASNAIFVAGGEIGHAARDFAIVFIEAGKDEQGRSEIAPVAVCGVVKDQNLYVENGTWRARYVPAVLRMYPFCVGQVEADRFALGMDAQSSVLSATEGEPLFTEAGTPSPLLAKVFEQLKAFDADSQRTRALCGHLRDLGLLQPSRFDATLEGGTTLGVDGFYVVDEKKLGELPDADVLQLHKSGGLGLVHAHYVSLGHLNKLAEWHAQRLKAAAPASA